MIGNYKLIVLFDMFDPNVKWLIHAQNVGTRHLYNMIEFMGHNIDIPHFRTLFKPYQETIINKSTILPSDEFRKLSRQEYMYIGEQLKQNNLIYNKKTNKLEVKNE